jgi:ribulose-phosphate 3-epimerase
MSVNPGFGGQKFISFVLDKVKELKNKRGNRRFLIEVDGGVNSNNAPDLIRSGADILVAGSAVFGQKDREKAISDLRM